MLLAITIVAFFLSPGTILLSMALGMIVVTVLSMIGAIVVTPAAVSLLGHRVNMWQIGGAPSEGGGAISAIVSRVTRRPALAAGLLAALLALVAAPVLAIETTPADPRVLPKDSDGLAAFYALRKAGFGPEIDVALVAPEGHAARPGPARADPAARAPARAGRRSSRPSPGPGLIADADGGAAPRAEADPQVQAPAQGRRR